MTTQLLQEVIDGHARDRIIAQIALQGTVRKSLSAEVCQTVSVMFHDRLILALSEKLKTMVDELWKSFGSGVGRPRQTILRTMSAERQGGEPRIVELLSVIGITEVSKISRPSILHPRELPVAGGNGRGEAPGESGDL